MNRRALFTGFVPMSRDRSPMDIGPETGLIVAAGLEPHSTPLTREDVYHLLRRIGFGPTYQQATAYVGRNAADVVEELLGSDDEADLPSPGNWIDAVTENPEGADLQTRFAIEGQWNANMAQLGNWWLKAMAADVKAVEKLTAFWNDHFATEFSFDQGESYTIPQILYRKYLTLRKDRLGDFRRMCLDVTLDDAMVWYLGSHFNEVGRPNENYARELMELFTTGIGWYTEGDVKEAARVLTGWKSQRYNDEPAPNGQYKTWFNAARHDVGTKQFMGQTIPARTVDNNTEFQVKNEEVYRLIEILFQQRPEAVGRFIADKLYRFYVYSSPTDVDATVLNQLAQVFIANDFRIKPLLKTLFSSAHFFDLALRGAQIKTPVEYVASFMHALGTDAGNPQSWVARMDQAMMDPPTVAGWPGYRSWISTNTYPVRRQFVSAVVGQMSDTDLMSFITGIADHTDAKKFVREVVGLLLPMPVSEERHTFYLSALLQNTPDYEWPQVLQDPSAAAARVRGLLTTLSKAPDFQLC